MAKVIRGTKLVQEEEEILELLESVKDKYDERLLIDSLGFDEIVFKDIEAIKQWMERAYNDLTLIHEQVQKLDTNVSKATADKIKKKIDHLQGKFDKALKSMKEVEEALS